MDRNYGGKVQSSSPNRIKKRVRLVCHGLFEWGLDIHRCSSHGDPSACEKVPRALDQAKSVMSAPRLRSRFSDQSLHQLAMPPKADCENEPFVCYDGESHLPTGPEARAQICS